MKFFPMLEIILRKMTNFVNQFLYKCISTICINFKTSQFEYHNLTGNKFKDGIERYTK